MADPKDGETCPVDHKAREAWLQHARAAGPNDAATSPAPPHPIPNETPPSQSWTQSLLSYTPFSGTSSQTTPTAGADACPVDHKSREAWLQQARAANATAAPHPDSPPPHALPAQAQQPSPSTKSWTQTLRSYVPFTSSPSPPPPAQPSPTGKSPLDTYREVSTIPRTSTSSYPYDTPSASAPPPTTLQSSHGVPSNNEQETGADAATGNWVYPSEKMFFEAMKRKGHDTRAADMRTVVPIHNAVNERAWKEIKEWEAPYTQGTA